MKFSKFVKSLAPDGGAIYEYMDKRWLASPSVLMLIPDGIRSVTGYSNEKMPDGIGRLISQVGCTEYATLVKAVMPEPDAAYFCHGWEKTRGCRIEHEAACAYGLTVIYEDGYNILNNEQEDKNNG